MKELIILGKGQYSLEPGPELLILVSKFHMETEKLLLVWIKEQQKMANFLW